MSFEIQTTSYFDSEAKRLAKRHRSFVDDLSDFRDSILKQHQDERGASNHKRLRP